MINAKRFEEIGGIIEDLQSFKGRAVDLPVVKIDAILGNGQSGPPKSAVAQLVQYGNELSGKWIALDIPTGLNGSTGEVFSPFVQASITISIQSHKRGLLQYPGRSITGSLVVVDVGIPVDQSTCRYQLLNSVLCRGLFKLRNATAHKGTLGTTMIIGGSSSMKGAPILAAQAALRVGAGKVFVASSREVLRAVSVPELMTRCIAEGHDIGEMPTDVSHILEGVTSLVIGPGLGRSRGVQELVAKIVAAAQEQMIPTIIDADALYVWTATASDMRFDYAVLTPHPGEARALLGDAGILLESDRYGAANSLRKRFRAATIVLKGARTIVEGSSSGYVDVSGNAALATPGSGDVLAGLIGGLCSQGYSCEDGALLGVWIHSALAQSSLGMNGIVPLTAVDLITNIPSTIRALIER
jgi:NAD(P)H-hydrate epimerase